MVFQTGSKYENSFCNYRYLYIYMVWSFQKIFTRAPFMSCFYYNVAAKKKKCFPHKISPSISSSSKVHLMAHSWFDFEGKAFDLIKCNVKDPHF